MKIVVGGNLGDKEIRCKSVATAIAVIRISVSRNAYSFANVKVLLGKREGNGVAMRQGIVCLFLHPWKGAFILSFCREKRNERNKK